MNEGATDQLGAWQEIDDATFLAVPTASVAWSVAGGPRTGINATGLATAAIVSQNTGATAQGSYLGNTGTLGLTVVNVNLDDFGAYAGDGTRRCRRSSIPSSPALPPNQSACWQIGSAGRGAAGQIDDHAFQRLK